MFWGHWLAMYFNYILIIFSVLIFKNDLYPFIIYFVLTL